MEKEIMEAIKNIFVSKRNCTLEQAEESIKKMEGNK